MGGRRGRKGKDKGRGGEGRGRGKRGRIVGNHGEEGIVKKSFNTFFETLCVSASVWSWMYMAHSRRIE